MSTPGMDDRRGDVARTARDADAQHHNDDNGVITARSAMKNTSGATVGSSA